MSLLWKVSLAVGIVLLTGCNNLPFRDRVDADSEDPYVAFTSAVTDVEPLIDPNFDALDDSQLTSANTRSDITDAQRLPTVTPLRISQNLAVVTSPELLPLNETLYQRFIQAGYSGVMDIDAMTASRAVQQFCQQPEVNLLTISRAMTPVELSQCRAAGRDPTEFPVARDALLVVVNPQDRFVSGVTLSKLQSMLTRDNWQAVDPSWPDAPIERGLIGPDSAGIALLADTLFAADSTSLLNAPKTTFYGYPEPMIQALNVTPYSLGIINYSTYQRLAQNFRAVPINGISASLETVESGAYPLSQTAFLYSDRTQMARRSATSSVVNFYLTYLDDAISEVALLPLPQTQLNASKAQWLNVMGLGLTAEPAEDSSDDSLEDITAESDLIN